MTENFDNQIREQLADYTPEVPSHIWENIAQRRKKRRGAFWIWLENNRKPMLLAGILAAAGLIVANHAIQNEADNSNHSMVSPVSNESTAPGKTHDHYTGTADKSVASVAIQSPEVAVSTETENSVAPMGSPVSSEMYEAAGPGSREESSGKGTKAAASIKNTTASSARLETEVFAASKENSNKRKQRKTKRPFAASATEEEMDVISTTDIAIEPATAPESKEPYSRTPQNFSFMRRKQPAEWIPQSKGVATGTIPCPEDVAAANKKYLEFYIGPDYTIRTFKDTANSEYLQKRKESTSIVFAFSAGARFTKVFNNAMSIRAGVNYSQINEKFSVVDGNIIKVIYILDANNDTIGNYSTRVNVYRTTYNNYHMVDIPLAIGYEFGNGNLHGNINAGVIANIYSWQKGSTLDNTFKSVSITTGGPASPYQFKTHAGLSFAGSLSLYYRFQDRIQLMAEPYFKYSLSPANKEEITLRQKFHTIGLRLGIRYDLDKIHNK